LQSFPLKFPLAVRALGGCVSVIVGLALVFGLMAGFALAVVAGAVLTIEGNLLGLALVGLALLALFLMVRVGNRKTPPREPQSVPYVRIGSDGIALHRLRTRFIPWWRVREVRRVGDDQVAIELDDDKIERLQLADAAVLERALRERLARRESAPRSEAIHSLEAEGGIDAGWIQRIKTLVTEPPYRVESINEDAVLAVLEDAAQRPVQRIGAALALSGTSGEAAKRVRVAIDDTADPELAQVLRAAETGDLDSRTLRRVARKLGG
jgi:hypothetical protein